MASVSHVLQKPSTSNFQKVVGPKNEEGRKKVWFPNPQAGGTDFPRSHLLFALLLVLPNMHCDFLKQHVLQRDISEHKRRGMGRHIFGKVWTLDKGFSYGSNLARQSGLRHHFMT